MVINYDRRGVASTNTTAFSDVKYVSLQDLMCWNIQIKVPTHKKSIENFKKDTDVEAATDKNNDVN